MAFNSTTVGGEAVDSATSISKLGRASPAGFLHVPPTVLDALVPGYSVLADFFLQLGFDISFYVSLFALGLITTTILRYTITPVIDYTLDLLCSSVVVEEYDPIFGHVLSWVGTHRSLQNLRSLRGHSQGHRYDDSDDEDGLEIHEQVEEDTIFNFNDWSARAPPKYEPHTSSGYFRHKGYIFNISRDKEQVASEWSGAVRDRERLVITVLWRSTKPIKALVEEAREHYLAKQTSLTVIRRPTSKEQRGRRHAWHKVAARPSRSMATVVLDDPQKVAILRDINDFLHPRTARWYSNRGIPYRRGYLFYGPPGTGKTSLSFALAGVFGLDIYCLSLSEITLTEEDLIMLFNTLPKRCIVLLEDIDSAGVSRPKPEDPKRKSSRRKSSKKKVNKDLKDDKIAKTMETLAKKVADATLANSKVGPPQKLTNAISISGLLNAIDGVASQEGRVLLMTTNFPEKLDDALVRPGRVDLKIEFALASKQQIRELFIRMYCVDGDDIVRQPTKIGQILPAGSSDDTTTRTSVEIGEAKVLTQPKSKTNGVAAGMLTPPGTPNKSEYRSGECVARSDGEIAEFDISTLDPAKLERADVEKLADRFAVEVPELTFSPAEIQGYLVVRKKSPLQAVLDIAPWRDEALARKEKEAGPKEKLIKDDSHGGSKTADESAAAGKQEENTQKTGEEVEGGKENASGDSDGDDSGSESDSDSGSGLSSDDSD